MTRALLLWLIITFSPALFANSGFITVERFLSDCQENKEPCMAFVMGVVEGARHQTREHLKEQPYSFMVHGKPVCLPNSWDSKKLAEIVISVLETQPQVKPYSAVSGVLIALSSRSTCNST